MTATSKIALATALILAGLTQAALAHPDGTTTSRTEWETTTRTIAPPGAHVLYPEDFDINKDKILTRVETGEHLFRIYDGDGNEVIDNNEYERRAVLTLMPVKTETTIRYDLDGDGSIDSSKTTSAVFFERTMLSRFDKNDDGISPREFTNRAFKLADIDNDHMVDLKEWKASYNATLDARLKRDAEVNSK
jgi:hypothetical protein